MNRPQVDFEKLDVALAMKPEMRKRRKRWIRENRRVYVAVSEQFNVYKVGCSARVHERIAELRRIFPDLRLITSWPGQFLNESALHSRLYPFRLFGEWFQRSPQSNAIILAAISDPQVNPGAMP
jgi:hypothetical protein